jgi:hypothetical protein
LEGHSARSSDKEERGSLPLQTKGNDVTDRRSRQKPEGANEGRFGVEE